MKQCIHCGAQLSDESAFCTNCGKPVAEPPQEEAAAAFPQMPAYTPEEFPAPEAEAPQAVESEPAAPQPAEYQPVSCDAPEVEAQENTQEPTIADNYEEKETYDYDSSIPPVAPAPVKKSKGKLIALLIIGLLLIGIGVAAYFVATWYFSPEQEILRLVEDKDYTNAQTLVNQNMNLRYNKDLENQVSARLEEIKTAYTQKSMDYASAAAELDAIEKLELEGLKSRIPEYRTYFNSLNQSRADMTTAEKFFTEGNYPEALEYFRKVIKDDPDYSKAAQRITDTVNAYRTKVLEEAAKYAEGGAYASAVTVIDAALEVLPEDVELTSQKAIYEKNNLDAIKADALSQAETAASGKDYQTALSILDKYTGEYGTDVEVSVKRNEYLESFVDAVLAQVDTLQNDKDFAGAIKAIDEGLKVATNHSRLTNRRTAVLTACVEYSCDEADKLADEKKYEDALKLLDDALKVVPDDETLLAKKTEIEGKAGKWLIEVCEPYESNSYNTNAFNMSGEERAHGFTMSSDHYAIWNLNGDYKMLTFDLGHADGAKMFNCTVKIYCDDVLVKTIEVSADKLPISYEINLEGVKQLKITTSDDRLNDTAVGFANVKIYK